MPDQPVRMLLIAEAAHAENFLEHFGPGALIESRSPQSVDQVEGFDIVVVYLPNASEEEELLAVEAIAGTAANHCAVIVALDTPPRWDRWRNLIFKGGAKYACSFDERINRRSRATDLRKTVFLYARNCCAS